VTLLLNVAEILRTTLHYDDFRMLPETSSLWPVFQCMIRFPGVTSTYLDRLAAVTLRLMLADLTSGDLLRLVAEERSCCFLCCPGNGRAAQAYSLPHDISEPTSIREAAHVARTSPSYRS